MNLLDRIIASIKKNGYKVSINTLAKPIIRWSAKNAGYKMS